MSIKSDKVMEYFEAKEFGCAHQIATFTGLSRGSISGWLSTLKNQGKLTLTFHKGPCKESKTAHTVYTKVTNNANKTVTPVLMQRTRKIKGFEAFEVELLRAENELLKKKLRQLLS